MPETNSVLFKVCDFGLSRVVDDINTMTGNIGTVAWIAPEIFQNKKYHSLTFNFNGSNLIKIDILINATCIPLE